MNTCNFKIDDNFLCSISNITTSINRNSLRNVIELLHNINDNRNTANPSITPTPTSTTLPDKVLHIEPEYNSNYYEFTIPLFCLLLVLLLLNVYRCIKRNKTNIVIKQNNREKQIITNPMYNTKV